MVNGAASRSAGATMPDRDFGGTWLKLGRGRRLSEALAEEQSRESPLFRGLSAALSRSTEFCKISGLAGWGTWIRTKAFRVRVGSSTAKLSPKRTRMLRAGQIASREGLRNGSPRGF